jgi:hypothetical protein
MDAPEIPPCGSRAVALVTMPTSVHGRCGAKTRMRAWSLCVPLTVQVHGVVESPVARGSHDPPPLRLSQAS